MQHISYEDAWKTLFFQHGVASFDLSQKSGDSQSSTQREELANRMVLQSAFRMQFFRPIKSATLRG